VWDVGANDWPGLDTIGKGTNAIAGYRFTDTIIAVAVR
jgi:hypothetical protein